MEEEFFLFLFFCFLLLPAWNINIRWLQWPSSSISLPLKWSHMLRMVKALMGPWWAHGDASPTLHCLFLDLFHMRGKYTYFLCLSHSVQFRCSAVSDSLWPHGLQHIRLPCPSPLPEACSNSCSTSQWCHLTISSSVVSFSSCLKSFPASGSLPMSQFFTSDGQSIRASLHN